MGKRRQRPNVGQTQTHQIRYAQAVPLGNVAQRIAARISVGRGVGHRADAHAVENHQDDAVKHKTRIGAADQGPEVNSSWARECIRYCRNDTYWPMA